MNHPICCNNILWRFLHADIFWINEFQFICLLFFSTVDLVSLEENISFIRSFCCHLVAKETKLSESSFSRYLSTWLAEFESKNYPWCVCYGRGGKGPLRAIPLGTGNWEGICESYLRAICWHPKLFQFPLTIRHQDINLSTWAMDLDSLLKVGHYGHYNRWSVFPNLS